MATFYGYDVIGFGVKSFLAAVTIVLACFVSSQIRCQQPAITQHYSQIPDTGLAGGQPPLVYIVLQVFFYSSA